MGATTDEPEELLHMDEPEPSDAGPCVLASTAELPEGSGAVWRLEPAQRDLDANVVALPAGDSIATHEGPDLDVLVHVVHGGGRLLGDAGGQELAAGDLVWLPRRTRRGFTAGPEGLRYLTVHQRRQSLVVGRHPPEAGTTVQRVDG